MGPSPVLTETVQTLYNVHSGGDLLRLCYVNGLYQLEGSVGCPSMVSNGEGPSGGEFYYNDDFYGMPGGEGGYVHAETALGGIDVRFGAGEVAATHFDAVQHPVDADGREPFPRHAGVRFHTSRDGALTHRYEVYPDSRLAPGTYGKAAGLGDLSLLCEPAPIEIGNRVWNDSVRPNGIQDPDEPGIPGVEVGLYENNLLIATTMTNEEGGYYFNGANVEGGLRLHHNYTIQIELAQPALTTFTPTLFNYDATSDLANLHDSDGDPIPVAGRVSAQVLTGAAGANDHTFDFGFVEGRFDLALRKVLAAGQPYEVAPGEQVKFAIVVYNQGDVAAANIVIRDYIPDELTLVDPAWNPIGSSANYTVTEPLAPGEAVTVEITLRVAANLLPGTIVNVAEIEGAQDLRGKTPKDADSLPDADKDNESTTKDNVVDEHAKVQPDTDEDDHDPASLLIPTMSLGNRVWLDEGDGAFRTNNGQIDNEQGIDSVELALLDADRKPILDGSGAPMTTTTDANGYYLFDNLPPGDYIVWVVPANFGPGGPLEGVLSSLPTEADPNQDVDSNDNGTNEENPRRNGVYSALISLTFSAEPTVEGDQSALRHGSALDGNSNLTVDFGFVHTPTALGEISEPNANRFSVYMPIVK